MNNRGGSGRGQGRKPITQGEKTIVVSIRLSQKQSEKLSLLGGSAWVRSKIDSEK